MIELNYDADNDAAMLRFGDPAERGRAVRSVHCFLGDAPGSGHLEMMLDAEGRLTAIAFLHAKAALPAEVLRRDDT
jgi:Protein of unknown function (DUF2283)